jgi:hypothetical protein
VFANGNVKLRDFDEFHHTSWFADWWAGAQMRLA